MTLVVPRIPSFAALPVTFRNGTVLPDVFVSPLLFSPVHSFLVFASLNIKGSQFCEKDWKNSQEVVLDLQKFNLLCKTLRVLLSQIRNLISLMVSGISEKCRVQYTMSYFLSIHYYVAVEVLRKLWSFLGWLPWLGRLLGAICAAFPANEVSITRMFPKSGSYLLSSETSSKIRYMYSERSPGWVGDIEAAVAWANEPRRAAEGNTGQHAEGGVQRLSWQCAVNLLLFLGSVTALRSHVILLQGYFAGAGGIRQAH